MIVVFFQCTLKEKLPIFLINTLLLHIPLLALTDLRTDGITEDQIHLLRVGWRNFFPVVLLCQILVVAGNSFRCYFLPYQLCRCVFFWLRREIVLGCTDQFFGCGGKQFWVLLTYNTSCAVVSFFLLWQEIVYGCTDQFFGCGGKQFQVLLT